VLVLKHFLTIAWRNLMAHRLYSAINVLGLTIGLASCILIALFVNHELSYDRHYKDADRIVRVALHMDSEDLHLATIAAANGPRLLEDIAEVEAVTRLSMTQPLGASRGDRSFDDLTAAAADPNFFDFFELKFIKGESKSGIDQIYTAVLSESAAERLFGNEEPLGETITVAGLIDLKVTGIFQDLPENTHLDFDLLTPIALHFALNPLAEENWGNNIFYTYLRLSQGYDAADLETKFPAFLSKHLYEDAPIWNRLEAQWLTDIHLFSQLDAEMKANGSFNTVLIFFTVAVVLLVIACINFMNLATARSTQRAKEVGVRKAVGASRGQLIVQFLGESILLSAVAMLLAVALVELLLPWFSSFVERELEFNYLSNPTALLALLGGVFDVGIVAGSYPAFHLSSFRPTDALKGTMARPLGSINIRKSLVVVQFAISITLMIATGVVLSQLNYTQSKDLGFDREHNIIAGLPVDFDGDSYRFYPPFRDALLAHPAIQSTTISANIPTQQVLNSGWFVFQGSQAPAEESEMQRILWVGFDFFEHYGIEIVAGRPFGAEYGDEFLPSWEEMYRAMEEEVPMYGQTIINESAVRQLGLSNPSDAIGRILIPEDSPFPATTIVGVAADIHFSSLHTSIPPVQYILALNLGTVSIKSAPGQLDAAYAHIQKVWDEQFPGRPKAITFLDDKFDAMYRQDRRQAQLFGIFAGLAIFVASLGLFGLASFSTERRSKEIGIRKVMGASVKDIVWMLTREFNLLVLIANVIAWPVAYYLMSDWLTRFAYAIHLDPLIFAAAALAAFLIAWLTVASQAGKAAMARPIQALRYE
jgi:putative ABC transport system permease protein